MHGRGGMQRMGPQQAMGVGHGLRHGAEMLGGPGFMYRNGYAYGEYVTFSVNETSGIVYDYGISRNPLLTSIEVVDFEYGSTIVRGALTRIINIIAPAVTISGQMVTVDAPANSIVLLRAAPVIFGYDGAVRTMNRNVVRRGVNDRIGAEISIGARGAYCIFDYNTIQ